ncbi:MULTISPECIES: family 43 glycosylhydrolase [Paenibacillus]|jgi:sucrose-6-phosphate hydrolase SacC (GH32 family)|uniref:Family 43 glycosylhydrolase n=1 Tax=Paenibacillus violae TaxID=3077234 RepID=A0ABU3RCU7_9BACL|nr:MULTISPECIES: family 43 glycosylhydrolase [Paenibacillus]MDU0202109.1 family 43 glycosylhydrolase [Paenibacillus sp. PFR10]MEC0270294.1 family 43 glycosylhydrolase [Paenibacillus anseongense]
MMYYADHSRGKPYAKDPAVVKFKGKYWMYYSIPSYEDGRQPDGWGIGIAVSDDLEQWERVGEMTAQHPYEINGICAPGAIVLNGSIHLFYQTYGNFPKDAICHAVSEDGLHFERNKSNPVFSPTGEWNNGRAIDADVIIHQDKLFLYFATRDPKGEIQMQGVATAPLDSDFGAGAWTQACDQSILKPELPWEGQCIEAAATCKRNGKVFMFYAGAYNNWPQQIGCAVSEDGVHFQRLFSEPLLPNGEPGSWNSSESGHPYLFEDEDQRTYLFFQGNNDNGETWYLSYVEIGWEADGNIPVIIPPL